MKPKTMILMVIAIVCGLGASYMTSRLLADRTSEVQEIPKVNVVIAKKELSVGQCVKKPEEMFEIKEFTKGQEPKDSLLSFDHLKGKFVKRNLRKGDFITPKEIDDTTQLLELPPNTVAVGIRVTPESIANGFAAQPGSRVDILWATKGSNNSEAQCITLLESILVVAADLSSGKDPENKVFVANVVTVALTREDAQKVQLAKDFGTLSLTLRRMEEEGGTSKSPTKLTLTQLLTSPFRARTAKSRPRRRCRIRWRR